MLIAHGGPRGPRNSISSSGVNAVLFEDCVGAIKFILWRSLAAACAEALTHTLLGGKSLTIDDSYFMAEALKLAEMSALEEEVPVGAVIAKGGRIIAIGRNRRELGKNALAHAELEAINNACKVLGGWRLWECDLFVSLEPCPMCAGAIINARIKRVVFGASEPKAGSCGSVVNLFDKPYNHKPAVISGVLEAECAQILTNFFRTLRAKRVR